jgi:microcompartment protein CcmL/EutN
MGGKALKAGEGNALGIIETAGRAALIEAVDSAIKAAAVTLKSSYFVGGGVNTVTLTGDVGAMRAALDAAKATLERMGVVGQTHLIPRLAETVWPLIMDQSNGRYPSSPPKVPGPKKPEAALENAVLPEEAPVSAEADAPAEAGTPGEALFPDETPRPGRKASAPKKKSGGAGSGKNPRKEKPEN